MASRQILHLVIPCCKKKSFSLCKPATKKNLYVKKQFMVKITKFILLAKLKVIPCGKQNTKKQKVED